MAIGGVIGGIANAIAVGSNGGSVGERALAALAGFIGSALGTGASLLMATTPATTPYADIVGRGVATFVTDICTAAFINKEITVGDVVYAAFDMTMDMTFSTTAAPWEKLPILSDELIYFTFHKSIFNALLSCGKSQLAKSYKDISLRPINLDAHRKLIGSTVVFLCGLLVFNIYFVTANPTMLLVTIPLLLHCACVMITELGR